MATASKPSYSTTTLRPLSTTEGFLLGGVAACVAVSSATLRRQLPDPLSRLLSPILPR